MHNLLHGEGDGGGWAVCSLGHRHWGLFGAAGILVTSGDRVLLQHRAAWTHEGGTWSIPGGARDSHEDAITAALREAGEETTLTPADLAPYAEWVDDHGGWSYTTVIAALSEDSAAADASGLFAPAGANAETEALTWWNQSEVESLDLHTGFAAAWPHLRALIVG